MSALPKQVNPCQEANPALPSQSVSLTTILLANVQPLGTLIPLPLFKLTAKLSIIVRFLVSPGAGIGDGSLEQKMSLEHFRKNAKRHLGATYAYLVTHAGTWG